MPATTAAACAMSSAVTSPPGGTGEAGGAGSGAAELVMGATGATILVGGSVGVSVPLERLGAGAVVGTEVVGDPTATVDPVPAGAFCVAPPQLVTRANTVAIKIGPRTARRARRGLTRTPSWIAPTGRFR